MDFNKIEDELVQQRSTVEKVVDKGGETVEQRVGHKSEIDKGEQEVASFLDKRAQQEK
jgi:antitoxin protein of toxin-antitoxin system